MTEKRKPPIRQRPIQVKFFVDEKELDLIKNKMALLGTENIDIEYDLVGYIPVDELIKAEQA